MTGAGCGAPTAAVLLCTEVQTGSTATIPEGPCFMCVPAIPECDSYVRVHAGTNIPVGSMANHELRTLRRTAHHYFDQLYESGYMSKQDAYQWLADLIMAPLSEAHIGHLGEYYCKQVIEESRKLLERRKAKTRGDIMHRKEAHWRRDPDSRTAEESGAEYSVGSESDQR